MREQIKRIILENFSALTDIIEKDFSLNYKRKVNNFLLSQMDKRIIANMVFVSSFESKSGFAIEKCAQQIARLTFGEDNVPALVNPRNLRHNIVLRKYSDQRVVTDVDTNNGSLRGEIAAFRANNQAVNTKGKREASKVTHESCKAMLLPLSAKYRSSQIYTKPVDLAFFDGENWNIMELKAGGDLDSSNASSNVEKLLTIYVDMGVENCKAYFATLYNKDGEGNVWTGSVKKHLNYPSMFLIGKRFWERILPDGVTYEKLTDIYCEALEKIDLNKRINDMIIQCVEN